MHIASDEDITKFDVNPHSRSSCKTTSTTVTVTAV